MHEFSSYSHRIPLNDFSYNFLSCDDWDDAVRSLAFAYNIPMAVVLNTINNDWPDFLHQDVELGIFQETVLTWCMGQHMKCSDIQHEDLKMGFYHRGIFDGNNDWFKDGLLNAVDGGRRFLHSIKKIIPPECDFDLIENIALGNIDQRNNLEGSLSGGPYAFNSLEDAISAQRPGLDYSTPEMFLGKAWELTSRSKLMSELLIGVCQKNLTPVVVKFISTKSDPHAYVNSLWGYVYRKKFGVDSEARTTFVGRGRSIPYCEISDLFVTS